MKTSSISKSRHRRGFTLMELLLVLAIIGMLVGGGTTAYVFMMDNARFTKTQAQLGTVNNLLQIYQTRNNGKLPAQSVGLQALVNAGIVGSESDLQDAWANPFVYVIPAKRSKDKYDIFSKGKDGIEGTGDDIGNWEGP